MAEMPESHHLPQLLPQLQFWIGQEFFFCRFSHFNNDRKIFIRSALDKQKTQFYACHK